MQGQSHCPTGRSGRSKSGWYHGVFPGFRQMRLRPFLTPETRRFYVLETSPLSAWRRGAGRPDGRSLVRLRRRRGRARRNDRGGSDRRRGPSHPRCGDDPRHPYRHPLQLRDRGSGPREPQRGLPGGLSPDAGRRPQCRFLHRLLRPDRADARELRSRQGGGDHEVRLHPPRHLDALGRHRAGPHRGRCGAHPRRGKTGRDDRDRKRLRDRQGPRPPRDVPRARRPLHHPRPQRA